MKSFLKIENPGVCPPEGFTLLGASSKRGTAAIGKFGTGNKHGINVCLRHNASPVVFSDMLRMDFFTFQTQFAGKTVNQVGVKYAGKDSEGKNRSSTKELGWVLEHGSDDWLGIDLALREFVSNAIDSAMEDGEYTAASNYIAKSGHSIDDFRSNPELRKELERFIEERRLSASDWNNIKVELVGENQVRAKSGTTRVFVPVNDEVFKFFNYLENWFLHFSEPHLLHKEVLPKDRRRNLSDRDVAVIYRRGVRVREIESTSVPSLFDYNLESLPLDESRQVDDWRVQHFAGVALINSPKEIVKRVFQSFGDKKPYWEHEFSDYALRQDRARNWDEVRKIWNESLLEVYGDNTVVTQKDQNKIVESKGYERLEVPMAFESSMRMMGLKTAEKVLTLDDLNGRTITEASKEAVFEVDYVWDILAKMNLTGGKEKPGVKGFESFMDSGMVVNGFYREGVVYINNHFAEGTNMRQVVLEELAHYVTGSLDETRDFQDYAFKVAAMLM